MWELAIIASAAVGIWSAIVFYAGFRAGSFVGAAQAANMGSLFGEMDSMLDGFDDMEDDNE